MTVVHQVLHTTHQKEEDKEGTSLLDRLSTGGNNNASNKTRINRERADCSLFSIDSLIYYHLSSQLLEIKCSQQHQKEQSAQHH